LYSSPIQKGCRQCCYPLNLKEAQANNNYNDIIKFIENSLEKTFEFYFEHISNNWQEEIENFKQ